MSIPPKGYVGTLSILFDNGSQMETLTIPYNDGIAAQVRQALRSPQWNNLRYIEWTDEATGETSTFYVHDKYVIGYAFQCRPPTAT